MITIELWKVITVVFYPDYSYLPNNEYSAISATYMPIIAEWIKIQNIIKFKSKYSLIPQYY